MWGTSTNWDVTDLLPSCLFNLLLMVTTAFVAMSTDHFLGNILVVNIPGV